MQRLKWYDKNYFKQNGVMIKFTYIKKSKDKYYLPILFLVSFY